MVEADTVSTIQLLELLQATYPLMARIQVYLDNARYHHAKLVNECWRGRDAASYCTSCPPIARI